MTKKRVCPHCGYKWESDSAYGAGEVTKCPKCEELVPGDSIAKGG